MGVYLFLLIFSISTLFAFQDQSQVLFGSNGYILYKVLDFANDHGFRYIQVLSYEFDAFNHKMSVICNEHIGDGDYFELKDQYGWIRFICFEKKPENSCIIDLEKYRDILKIVQHH